MVKISAQDIFIAQSSATRKPNGFDSRLFLRFYLFPFLLSFRKGINDIRIQKWLFFDLHDNFLGSLVSATDGRIRQQAMGGPMSEHTGTSSPSPAGSTYTTASESGGPNTIESEPGNYLSASEDLVNMMNQVIDFKKFVKPKR